MTILCLFITGGQVIAYIVGWMFSSVTGGWRWIVGLGIIPALLQFAIVVFLPETPRWLVQAGLDTRAMDVLAKVYQEHPDCVQITKRILRDIQQEVAEEEEELGHSSHDSGTKFQWAKNVLQTSRDLFLVGGNRRALTIAMMLQGLQQLCGFNRYYLSWCMRRGVYILICREIVSCTSARRSFRFCPSHRRHSPRSPWP